MNNNLYKELQKTRWMPIVGFNFDKMVVEKKKPIVGDVRIKNDMNIKDLFEDKIALRDKRETVLRFNFEFLTEYQKGIGNIIIEGHILYLDEVKKIKEIVENWKKNRSVETELLTRVLNTILVRCNIKVLTLAQDMNLPPNIKLPTVSPKQNVNDYIG